MRTLAGEQQELASQQEPLIVAGVFNIPERASGLPEAPALTITNAGAPVGVSLPALLGLAPVRLPVLLLVPGYQRQLASLVQAGGGETFRKSKSRRAQI